MTGRQSSRTLKIAQLERDLTMMVANVETHCEADAPTYEVWRDQCIYVDVTMQMALEKVCVVLPLALQPPVRRLLALYQAVWHGDASTDRGEGAP